MKIIAKAPTRISLFGGGTDCDPFNTKFGGKVINFAINLRNIVELIPRDDKWIWIEAMGESRIWRLDGKFKYNIDPKFDLIRAIMNQYDLKNGLYLKSRFEGIQSAGLGSSASAAVAMIGAMDYWQGKEIEKYDIALKAYELETRELGWYSGWQDQFASAYGGFNYFKYWADSVSIRSVDRVYINSMLPYLALFFTGKIRKSSDIQRAFYDDMKKKQNYKPLWKIKDMVRAGYYTLEKFEPNNFGKLMEKSWKLKKKTSPLSSNKRIDDIYKYAKKLGAIGGKVLGAGGEGHILFVVENRDEFIQKMEERGLKHIDFGVDWNGLEVRKV